MLVELKTLLHLNWFDYQSLILHHHYPKRPKPDTSLHKLSGSFISSKFALRDNLNLLFCGTISTKLVDALKAMYSFLNSTLTP